MNTSDPNPYIQASKDILGEDGVYYMVAYKPLQDSSAFRLWCKANDMNIKEYDEIAKNLEEYVNDDKWKDIIEESKVFKGVIESVAPSPCSFLLLDKPISEEIGLMKVGDIYCCCLDGYNCDRYKYLKNDLLTVSVWKIIKETCDLIGIDIPTIKELENLLNEKAYSMYELGLTCTLNQADSDFATPLFEKFSPKNIAEVAQMVCMIRPGAASMLNDFIERKPYTTGFKELDELLKDSQGRMCYQESVMSFLIWLGIPEAESYGVLKKIAKKKFTEKELEELHEQLTEGWINKIGSIEGFQKMWDIVEANASYSFNSSHSLSVGLDSLYGAFLKANYPLQYYTVVFNNYQGDAVRTAKLTEELKYFDIQLKQPKFRYANANYSLDKETNTIYKGISSIKFLNEKVAEELYELRDNQYDTFIDLLIDLKNTSINSRQLDILIKIGFFSDEFGARKYLLDVVNVYNKWFKKKTFKKSDLPLSIDKMREISEKETNAQFSKVDNRKLCEILISVLDKEEELSIGQIISDECEYYGSPTTIDDSINPRLCIALETNVKYTPVVKFYNIYSGRSCNVKISKKLWRNNPIEKYDMVYLNNTYKKNKMRKEGNEWVTLDEQDTWCDDYTIEK